MTFRHVVEWVVPSVFTLVLLLWWRKPGEDSGIHRALWRWRWPILIATRLLWPYVVSLVINLRKGTDLGWRVARSDQFLAGGLPGVDYPNFHAPLIPYLEGVGRWLVPGHPPVGAVLFFVLGDVAAVVFGARLARRFGGSAEAWVGTWLLLSPVLWHQSGIRAQDESLFVATLAAALWFASRKQDIAAGLALAVGLCATKLTYAPYAAAILLCLGTKRFPAHVAFVLGTAAIYGAYALTGAPLGAGESVARHGSNFGAGIGIPDTIHRFFPGFSAKSALLGYAVVTGAIALLVPWRLRHLPVEDRTLLSVVAVHAASMLTMPFCVSPYFTQAIVPLLLLVYFIPEARRRPFLIVLTLFAWLCVMHWTRAAMFTVPMKPLMILFHGGLLAAVLAGAFRSGAIEPSRLESQ